MALFGEVGYALIRPAGRAIGNIIPDVVVEEAHQDRLVITQHPVEGGGLISDHAYKLNPVVEIRAGFSDSSAGEVGYSRAAYDALRQLQDRKELIDVFTGKRAYRNMLPAGIAIVTDERTENSLIAILALEQLTLVTVQTTGAGPDTAAASNDPANQADPASTGSVTNGGNVEAQGVGSQAFAGAFSPGAYSTTPSASDLNSGSALGGTLGGSTGFSAEASGLSPPPVSAEMGELVATDPSGNALPEATVPATPGYNPFATGAFGGT